MAKRQNDLPGMERKTIKEIDTAAETYVDARDKRMKASEHEKTRKDALIAVMKKHGVEVYKDETANPPLVVTVTPGKDNVKVTTAETDESEESES